MRADLAYKNIFAPIVSVFIPTNEHSEAYIGVETLKNKKIASHEFLSNLKGVMNVD